MLEEPALFLTEEKKARVRPALSIWQTRSSHWTAATVVLFAAVASGAGQTPALPEAPSSLIVASEPAFAATVGPLWPQTTPFTPPVRTEATNNEPPTPGSAVVQPFPGSAGKGYGWRGLIWQSVEFNVAENGFRASADRVIRDDLAHKPFWHDWLASMHQFNMRRWNDGDTFIVNYIGHSLHGAVAADIEIQNSPTQARLEWGDPGYTKSRVKGFLWATVYSTHSEISPAGEAGVGNEGGFTYGVECQYHCNSSNFHAGDHYTNNTGWVDFIVTPTAGMLWVVGEDLIDKYISDRLAAEHPGKAWPKFVRGALTPSRSFVNWLRWQPAWYRDFEHPAVQPSRVSWFPDEEQAAWQKPPQLQIAPYYSRISIASNTPTCFNCRTSTGGPGLEASVRLRDWLSFDTAATYHANASLLPSDRAGGNLTEAVFGLRATRQWRYYAVHAALRPGFLHYTKAYLTSPAPVIIQTYPNGISTHGGNADSVPGPGVVDANGAPNQPQLGDITHFVWDFALGVDYRLSRNFGVRLGVDDAVVRYRTDKVNTPGVGTPPYLSWLSKENFIMRGNPTFQVGPIFSF